MNVLCSGWRARTGTNGSMGACLKDSSFCKILIKSAKRYAHSHRSDREFKGWPCEGLKVQEKQSQAIILCTPYLHPEHNSTMRKDLRLAVTMPVWGIRCARLCFGACHKGWTWCRRGDRRDERLRRDRSFSQVRSLPKLCSASLQYVLT